MAQKKSGASEIFSKRFQKGNTVEPVRWAFADKNLVHRLIDAVVACGGLVSFSATRDATSYVITFLHDNIDKDSRKWYVGNAETVNDNLLEWVETWEGLLEDLESAKRAKSS